MLKLTFVCRKKQFSGKIWWMNAKTGLVNDKSNWYFYQTSFEAEGLFATVPIERRTKLS